MLPGTPSTVELPQLEFKRHTDAVCIFPITESACRLLGALLVEIDAEMIVAGSLAAVLDARACSTDDDIPQRPPQRPVPPRGSRKPIPASRPPTIRRAAYWRSPLVEESLDVATDERRVIDFLESRERAEVGIPLECRSELPHQPAARAGSEQLGKFPPAFDLPGEVVHRGETVREKCDLRHLADGEPPGGCVVDRSAVRFSDPVAALAVPQRSVPLQECGLLADRFSDADALARSQVYRRANDPIVELRDSTVGDPLYATINHRKQRRAVPHAEELEVLCTEPSDSHRCRREAFEWYLHPAQARSAPIECSIQNLGK